jgi:tetratricopeptide (TPR) repeat protein
MAVGTPSVFLVYAHDTAEGEPANSQLVVKLIHWLCQVKVNVLSDRTPLGDQMLLNSAQDTRSRGDILWNQLRVIPRCRYQESADIVLLCCSTLLKKYHGTCTTGSQSNIYNSKIEAAYRCSQECYMLKDEMYKEIHKVIRNESSDDFHHVLTELGLLKPREANGDTLEDESDSVIPVLVNGEYGDYSSLPFCNNPTTIVCKLKCNGSNLLDRTRKEHKLFFDVLIRLSSPEYDNTIRQLSKYYWSYTEKLVEANKTLSEQEQSDLENERKQAVERAQNWVERTKLAKRNQGQYFYLSIIIYNILCPTVTYFILGWPRPVTDIPYLRNTKFTGRYRELGNLFATFVPKASNGSSPCAALYGLGGIGKTQTATEFVYRLQKRYPYYSVFWIQANDETSFVNSYKKVAELLNILVDKKESLEIITQVNSKLAQAETGKWLMVVDGADDLGSENSLISLTVRNYIPRHRDGGILFITRSLDVANRLPKKHPVRIIKVDEMNEQEATALVYRSLQKDRQEILQDKATTKEFLKLLCYLPLALIQATSYFNNFSHITIEKYITMFRAQRGQAIELLEEGKLDNDNMDDSAKCAVATTWLISFTQVQKHNELTGEYMKFSSAIKDEAIPDDIFPDTKYKALTNKQERAIGTLVGFGFLKQQTDRRFYNMHRLVHLVIQSWLETHNKTSIWIQRVSRRLTEIIPYGSYEDRDIWTGYLPHGLQVAKSDEFAILPEKQRIELMDRIGHCYDTIGQYVAAEPLYKETLQLSKVFGIEHPDTLMSMNNLAALYQSQGKYEAAESLFKETLQLWKKVLGLEHPNTLKSIDHLAALYRSQGKYEAAEPLYKEAPELKKKFSGPKK